MSNKIKAYTLCGAALVVGVMVSWCTVQAKIAPRKISAIQWQKSYQEAGELVTPGWTNADFGRFEFWCRIDTQGHGSLFTKEAPGAGELPAVRRKLWVALNTQETSVIFNEWFPVVNSNDPETLKPMVTVASEQLFSVLPKTDKVGLISSLKKVQSIKWGKIQSLHDYLILPGHIKTKAGSIALFWKVAKAKTPELIVSQSPSAVADFNLAKKGYLWERSDGSTMIFQVRNPAVAQKGTVCLEAVAVVKTERLLGELKRIVR